MAEKKSGNGCLKAALIIAGVLFILYLLGNMGENSIKSGSAAVENSGGKTSDPFDMVAKTEIKQVTSRWEYGGDALTARALVKNNSDKNLAIRVEFEVYDKNGDLVTSEQSINTNIRSGSSGVVEWPFSGLSQNKKYQIKAYVVSTMEAF